MKKTLFGFMALATALAAGSGTTNGTFKEDGTPVTFNKEKEVEAFYPASLIKEGNLVWPAKQTSATVVPMYSKQTLSGAETENFSFASLGAVLQIVFNTKQENVTLKGNVTLNHNTVGRLTLTGTKFKEDIPEGTLPGKFTVNANGKQVRFSKGNLWADSNNALHFEANQYSFASTKDASHVSHFTWSSTVEAAVGDSYSGDYLFCDENHKVSVDGSDAIYYALSKDEWEYLFNNHSYKWGTVNGVNGYVIAPDGFTGTLADSYNDDAALATDNLVFLPAAGYGDDYGDGNDQGNAGYYWSSTPSTLDGSDYACDLYFNSDDHQGVDDCIRFLGCSIRAVVAK